MAFLYDTIHRVTLIDFFSFWQFLVQLTFKNSTHSDDTLGCLHFKTKSIRKRIQTSYLSDPKRRATVRGWIFSLLFPYVSFWFLAVNYKYLLNDYSQIDFLYSNIIVANTQCLKFLIVLYGTWSRWSFLWPSLCLYAVFNVSSHPWCYTDCIFCPQ